MGCRKAWFKQLAVRCDNRDDLPNLFYRPWCRVAADPEQGSCSRFQAGCQRVARVQQFGARDMGKTGFRQFCLAGIVKHLRDLQNIAQLRPRPVLHPHVAVIPGRNGSGCCRTRYIRRLKTAMSSPTNSSPGPAADPLTPEPGQVSPTSIGLNVSRSRLGSPQAIRMPVAMRTTTAFRVTHFGLQCFRLQLENMFRPGRPENRSDHRFCDEHGVLRRLRGPQSSLVRTWTVVMPILCGSIRFLAMSSKNDDFAGSTSAMSISLT